MNLLKPVLSDQLVKALGWTFLHSLWIGALVCVVFLCTNWLLRHKQAGSRYLAGLLSLALMPVLVAAAFVWSYSELSDASEIADLKSYVSYEPVVDHSTEPAILEAPIETGLLNYFKLFYFEKYYSLLVGAWLAGVLMFSLHYVGGYFYSNRLRTLGLVRPSDNLLTIFERLRRKAGISRQVQFMESLLIKAPLVIGYFKPVVLLPVGLAAGISVAEVEAILAHELAHIRRHDFLINIFQSCVEVVFFFHPAIWIISSSVRTERENCCDDAAVDLIGNKLHLARALALAEEWKLQQGAFALGFSGRKNSLLNRIKRIINDAHMKTRRNESSLLGNLLALAIIAGLCLSTYTALGRMDSLAFQEPVKESVKQKDPEKDKNKNKDKTAKEKEKEKPEKVKDKSKSKTKASSTIDEDIIVEIEESTEVKENVNIEEEVEVEINNSVEVDSENAFTAIADERFYPMLASTDRAFAMPLPLLPPNPTAVSPAVVAVLPPMAVFFGAEAHPALAPHTARRVSPVVFLPDTFETDSAFRISRDEFAREMEKFARDMAEIQSELGQEMAARAAEMSRMAAEIAAHHPIHASEMVAHQQEMARHQEEMARAHADMAREMALKHKRMADELDREHVHSLREHEREMRRHEHEMREMEEKLRNHEKKAKEFEETLKKNLIEDGIISSGSGRVNLKMNANGLFVNDKKQSEALNSKYRKLLNQLWDFDFSPEPAEDEEFSFSFSF